MKLGKQCSIVWDTNGTKTYHHRNGKIHRLNGPACENLNGDQYWYINGVLHREDGPAYQNSITGYKEWYLNGLQFSEENHRRKLAGEEIIPQSFNWPGTTGIYYGYGAVNSWNTYQNYTSATTTYTFQYPIYTLGSTDINIIKK